MSVTSTAPAPDDDGQVSVSGARRVLVVSSELPPGPGGIGAHAYSLATELRQQGREVALLGSQHYADEEARDRFNDVSLVPVTTFVDRGNPARTALARFGQLNDAIDELSPDVVVASGGRVLWLAARACSRARVPFVAVAHGTEVGGATWQRALTRRALGRAAAIVAVSRFTARLVEDLGIPAGRVEVIHNGADGARFHPDAKRRQAFRDRHDLGDAPVILTVGNVTERKGQHLVVDALPRLLQAVPDARYVMVGRATEGEHLMGRARALGVSANVLLLGQLSATEVEDAHCAADVFAMTSTSPSSGSVEGFGIAVIEAALSAVPAVVTRGTGAEEAVVDEVTGLVVDAGPTSIGDALASLLCDDDRRMHMAAAAQERAGAAGTWSACAVPYGEVLDRVVAGSRPRVVVVSHTAHYLAADGTTVGFGPTLRELDHLATLASELVHVAPLHPGPPPGMALPITAPNIRHVPVPAAGGPRPIDRLAAMRVVPTWVRIINREIGRADIVHVRAPAGIAMIAMGLLSLRRNPRDRWVKYAGNWAPDGPDPITYRIQRAWLRHGLVRAAVTVNGRWPDQPRWVHAFDNPTLTEPELAAGRLAARDRSVGPPFRLVFVGRLETQKGADTAVTAAAELRRRGFDVQLDLIGDGPLRGWVEGQIAATDDGSVVLHGWLTRAQLEAHLARAHVMLLPTSASEGFPKVVGEALAFGCVPVTAGISSMGQVLSETGGAVVVEPGGSWADAVERLITDGSLDEVAAQGVASADRFSYRAYLAHVRDLARTEWGRTL